MSSQGAYVELTISLPANEQRFAVVGPAERNLKIIRESLGVTIWSRDLSLRIAGESAPVGQAVQVIEQLRTQAARRRTVNRQELLNLIAEAGRSSGDAVRQGLDGGTMNVEQGLAVYVQGKRIRAATEGQQVYLRTLFDHDLTFCIGPAGTGKTFLAVAAAAAALKTGQVRKIVLVRPAVEAGEKLGFLPGDMQQKVNPYLRPLLDALHDMMDFEQIQRFMACDVIEIIPLAFMRGRTLNDAMIILDEGQNTTRSQMMMFLTRLGHGSKMVVTGDTTQIDLEDPRESGLIDAVRRLRRFREIGMVTLDKADIVRHSLVQRIVEAYGDEQRSSRASPFDLTSTIAQRDAGSEVEAGSEEESWPEVAADDAQLPITEERSSAAPDGR
ncbi:MAG: PhoH family protein [Phycisphaeraceae bacterium]|nr:PhoH family protein [Phycisphaeraceae bacterium]